MTLLRGVLYVAAFAACVLLWCARRKVPSLRPVAAVVTFGLALDLVAALGHESFTRANRVPYHAGQSVALAWPAVVAWLALGVAGRRDRYALALALWLASVGACTYVWPDDPSAVYVAAQATATALAVGSLVYAGRSLTRRPSPGEMATAVLVLVEVAALAVPYAYAVAVGSTPTVEWPGGYFARAAGYVALSVIAYRSCSRSQG